jgi:hypothetical protein
MPSKRQKVSPYRKVQEKLQAALAEKDAVSTNSVHSALPNQQMSGQHMQVVEQHIQVIEELKTEVADAHRVGVAPDQQQNDLLQQNWERERESLRLEIDELKTRLSKCNEKEIKKLKREWKRQLRETVQR